MNVLQISLSRLLPFWETYMITPNDTNIELTYKSKSELNQAFRQLARLIPIKEEPYSFMAGISTFFNFIKSKVIGTTP